jgi:hypothetical protein
MESERFGWTGLHRLDCFEEAEFKNLTALVNVAVRMIRGFTGRELQFCFKFCDSISAGATYSPWNEMRILIRGYMVRGQSDQQIVHFRGVLR